MKYQAKYTKVTSKVLMAKEPATVLGDPRTCAEMFHNLIGSNVEQEHFAVAVMNAQGELLGSKVMFIGGTASTVVDAGIVGRYLLAFPGAFKFVVAHNHPTGVLRASKDDDAVTWKLKQVGELLDIRMEDHVIISPDGRYYSYSDEGRMQRGY